MSTAFDRAKMFFANYRYFAYREVIADRSFAAKAKRRTANINIFSGRIMANYKDINADLGTQTIEGTSPPSAVEAEIVMPDGSSRPMPTADDLDAQLAALMAEQTDATAPDVPPVFVMPSSPDDRDDLDAQLAALMAEPDAPQKAPSELDDINAKIDEILGDIPTPASNEQQPDSNEQPIILTPPATEDEQPIILTPPTAEDEQPIILTPPATEDEQPIILTPPAAEDEQPIILTPPAAEDEQPIILTPPAAESEQPVILTPPQSETEQPVILTPPAEEPQPQAEQPVQAQQHDPQQQQTEQPPKNDGADEARAMLEQAMKMMAEAQAVQKQTQEQMQEAAKAAAPPAQPREDSAATQAMLQQAQMMLKQAQEAQMQAQQAAQAAQLQAQQAAQQTAQLQAQQAAQMQAQQAAQATTANVPPAANPDPYASREVDRLKNELDGMRDLVNKLTLTISQIPGGAQHIAQMPMYYAAQQQPHRDGEEYRKLETELEKMRRDILEKDLRDREKELDRRQKEAENTVKDIRPEMVQMSDSRDIAPLGGMNSQNAPVGGEYIPLANGVYYSVKDKQVYVMTPASNAAAASPTIEPKRSAPAPRPAPKRHVAPHRRPSAVHRRPPAGRPRRPRR